MSKNNSEFITNAFAQKIASLKTVDYLEQRAKRGSKEHALDLLSSIPSHEPIKKDNF